MLRTLTPAALQNDVAQVAWGWGDAYVKRVCYLLRGVPES